MIILITHMQYFNLLEQLNVLQNEFGASIGAIFKHRGIDTNQAMENWPIGK